MAWQRYSSHLVDKWPEPLQQMNSPLYPRFFDVNIHTALLKNRVRLECGLCPFLTVTVSDVRDAHAVFMFFMECMCILLIT